MQKGSTSKMVYGVNFLVSYGYKKGNRWNSRNHNI